LEENIKIRSVKYNLIMNIILKISSFIFPLITLPYITRTLGAIGNGKVAFATSVVNYFAMFAQLGIPTYGVRACAKCRDNKDKLTQTVQELLLINMVAVVLSYFALIVGMLLIPKLQEEPELMLISSITIILNMAGMEWLYQSIEQYQYITIRNIIFKIISIVLMFLCVHNSADYIIYGALTVFSAGGSNILNLINCRKFLAHKTYFGRYNFRQHLKAIFVFFALSVAVSIYTSMDTVMLGFMSSDKEVAYYALATKVKMVLATTVSALGPVLLPRMTYCLNNDQYEKFKSYIEKSLHFVILSAVPVVVFFTVMTPEVIEILGGAEYRPAILCMQIITLAVIPLGIGNVACAQILTPLGKEKLTMYSTVCGAVINFIANAIFIPKMGAVGAALATVLAESVVAIIQIYYAWNEMKEAFAKIEYFKLILTNVVTGAFLIIVRNKLLGIQPIIVLMISCCAFFFVYGVMLLILKDSLVEKYVIPVMKRLKR
jgi:O-antigen/teichoic acid export membrane protein